MPPATDDTLGEGSVAIQCRQWVKDIEVVNLDDVPEGKALRMAGIDKDGNNVRTGKGKSPAAKAPPALEWTPVDLSRIAAADEGKKIRRLENGILHVEGPPFPFGNKDSTDYAVRLVLDWRDSSKSLTLRLRNAFGKSCDLRIGKDVAVLAEQEEKGKTKDFFRVSLDKILEPGTEVVVEAATIGPTIYGRVNGLFIGKADTQTAQKGNSSFQGGTAWIKRIEVIHLDDVADPLAKLGWDVSPSAPRAGTAVAP
jgi:hypothetical protein